jgi:monoamine oxidase
VLEGLVALYGEDARSPQVMLERDWGVDPFTLGYIATWAPGDLSRMGPLHGRHEPPFYVAGSDHWVAGYMEGAVRTGRAAALAALGETAAALPVDGAGSIAGAAAMVDGPGSAGA